MSNQTESTPHTRRVVTLEEARIIAAKGGMVLWRPDGREEAVVLEEPTEDE